MFVCRMEFMRAYTTCCLALASGDTSGLLALLCETAPLPPFAVVKLAAASTDSESAGAAASVVVVEAVTLGGGGADP